MIRARRSPTPARWRAPARRRGPAGLQSPRSLERACEAHDCELLRQAGRAPGLERLPTGSFVVLWSRSPGFVMTTRHRQGRRRRRWEVKALCLGGVLVLALVFTLGTPFAAASSTHTDYRGVLARLNAEIPQLMKAGGTVGLTIALVDGDRTVWRRGFGWADRARKVPVTANTLFHIGSVSKTMSAAAVIQLVLKLLDTVGAGDGIAVRTDPATPTIVLSRDGDRLPRERSSAWCAVFPLLRGRRICKTERPDAPGVFYGPLLTAAGVVRAHFDVIDENHCNLRGASYRLSTCFGTRLAGSGDAALAGSVPPGGGSLRWLWRAGRCERRPGRAPEGARAARAGGRSAACLSSR